MRIIEAQSAADIQQVKALFQEYQQFLGLELDFQGFAQELAALPGKYAKPAGNLYLAYQEDKVAGCIAFYPFDDGICELKRLFVRPAFAGYGIGKALMLRALQDASSAGYRFARLDSLRRLKSAGKLYPTLGFYEIEPYNKTPLDDAYYMERQLPFVMP